MRQLGAEHHRLPLRGNVGERDLRRDAVRRSADALFPASSACRRVLPRKFKIAFEGCVEDHALASIHDIGWRARIVDGKKGFRVTVAGGTSILPVSGYVLYDFLPVGEMFNVAEAVIRVFHRFGDYKHPSAQPDEVRGQGARLGRLPRALRGVPRRIPEGRGRSPARSIPRRVRRRGARRTGLPREAPTLQAVAAAASTPVNGPGIMPGTVRLQPLPDAFVRWMRSNVSKQRQQGYYHVTVRLPLGDFTAGQMRVLADLSEAYGDGIDETDRRTERSVQVGDARVDRAVLSAPRGGRTRRARCQHG